MIYLDKATVYANARQAYDEGRLQAQDPEQEGELCLYSGPCAIGVSLSPEALEMLVLRGEGATVIHLKQNDILETDDLYALSALQGAHDTWQMSRLQKDEDMFIKVLQG